MQAMSRNRRIVLVTIAALTFVLLGACSTTKPYSRGETRPANVAEAASD